MSGKSELAAVFIHLKPEDIVRLKFTLESYEGIGVVRTLCQKRAEIVVLTPACLYPEVTSILDSIQDDVAHTQIPAPKDLSGDWLLSEEWPVMTGVVDNLDKPSN